MAKTMTFNFLSLADASAAAHHKNAHHVCLFINYNQRLELNLKYPHIVILVAFEGYDKKSRLPTSRDASVVFFGGGGSAIKSIAQLPGGRRRGTSSVSALKAQCALKDRVNSWRVSILEFPRSCLSNES